MRANTTGRYRPKLPNLFIIALLLLATLLSTATQPVHAQEADSRESITLSPTSSQYTVNAGGAIDNRLTIVNDGKTAYDFIVYARPYSINGNQYSNPNFTNSEKPADLYAWVQFSQTKYHAAPGSTTYVNYSIHVPSGASPGGHYGVIFAEVQIAQQSTQGNAILRKKRVGSIIYATVNGDVRLAGDLALGGSIPFWQVQPPLHTTIAAKNTGNTHFTDSALLTVSDIFGNIKYRSKKDVVVLPNTTRVTDMDWDQASWFGLYKATTVQSFLGNTFKSEGYVLIMPRYLPVVLLIIILAGGVYAVVRRGKK